MRAIVAVSALVIGLTAPLLGGSAQAQRPRAQLTPVKSPVEARAGATAILSLKVQLPPDIHVQANKPKDSSLIPTVLTVDAPAGVEVGEVTYPPPSELAQADRSEKLAVLGPDFTIDVRLSIAATAPAGTVKVPARLRYQACTDKVCFPPTTGVTEWTLEIRSH
jgi:thiol:disulfide interchange protein DsbD